MTSVLIPLYNSSGVIEATLRSALKNLEPEDEIVVVDDASNDDSLRVAQEILEVSGSNYQIQSIPRGGACLARNHALSISNGDIIQWLDADDILGEEKLKTQRHRLNKNPNSLIVSPFIPFVGDPQNGAIREARNWPSSEIVTGADWLASERMTIPACWLGPRHIFEQAGPWNPQLKVNQDGEYFARVLAQAENVIFEPKVNVWYRRGNSESVSQFTAEKAESLFSSIQSIHETALALENSDRMRQMIANRYQHAIYTAYPYCPSGVDKAKKTLQGLPKPTISNPSAISPLSKIISSIFGWKALTRLRLLRNQLKR